LFLRLSALAKRSIIYIDGFNFYYGAVKVTPDKWLNLQQYFQLIRQDDEIQKIWYFTARVSGSQQVRQETYFEALSTLPLVQMVFGLYKSKTLKCRVKDCGYDGKKSYQVTEEKGTDVNIALQMLDDALTITGLQILSLCKSIACWARLSGFRSDKLLVI
jgi:6-hydroxy-3-succinoylpyridine 3-monooxygenase